MLTLQYDKHGECIRQEIGAAFSGSHPTDLLIVCADNEILRAHKLVLAAASPFIRSLLQDKSIINEGFITIHFPDISVEYFRMLLKFLYSGETYVPSNEVAKLHDLLALLQMSDLKSYSPQNNRSNSLLTPKNQWNAEVNRNNKRVLHSDRPQSKSGGISNIPVSVHEKNIECVDNLRINEILKQSVPNVQNFPRQDWPFVPYPSPELMLPVGQLPAISVQGAPPSQYSSPTHIIGLAANAHYEVDAPTSNQTTPERKHRCQQCGKQFHFLSHLKTHIDTHTSEKPYICPLCNEMFIQKYQVITHLCTWHRNVISPSADRYKCCMCPLWLETEPELLQHLTNDHNDILLTNRNVDNQEKQPTQINTTSERVYQVSGSSGNGTPPKNDFRCEYCGKYFEHLGNMKIHLRIHTGEKPFVCRFCSFSYPRKDSLINHLCSRHGNVISSSDANDQFGCCFCHLYFETQKDMRHHLIKDHKTLL